MRLLAEQVPDRQRRPQERRGLQKLARRTPRTDSPTHVQVDEINQSQALFQPRYDSIVYAPGRSESHVAQLARIAKSGSPLDPLKIAALGNDWYLVDGHHRLQAYQQAEWCKPIPVQVLQSDLMGDARISWLVRESTHDNKKNRLSMSAVDKLDAAWAFVAREDEGSIKDTAEQYGVGVRSVSNMRGVAGALSEAGITLLTIHSWSAAKSEAKRLKGQGGSDFDFDDKRKRLAARQLKGVMQMNLPPRMLAELLENYEPGLVDAMAFALKIECQDDGGEDM